MWRCAGPGGTGQCVGDGDSCRTADECCSGVCSPHETDDGTVLLCSPCVEQDGLCTTDGDCCGGTCVDGVCDGENECIPLGDECTDGADCCSGVCNENGYCGTVIID